MTHDARDSGSTESHDCKYADRARLSDDAGGRPPAAVDEAPDAYVTEARLKGIDEARRRLPPDRGLLERPVEVPFVPALLDRDDQLRLVHWIEFDPEYPLVHFLGLVPVPERAQWLLTYLERGVEGSRFFMLGVVDDHVVRHRNALYDLLLGYLVGLPDRHPLRLWELPTSVVVAASEFEPAFVRELVFGLVEPGREVDVQYEIDRLRDPWCDPENRERRLCPDIAELRTGIRRSSLERWWAIVSHPDHVRAEIDALPAACAKGRANRHTKDHRTDEEVA